MRDINRQEIDKKEIGTRIKRLRKEAGLRQWQLAQLIGATQPAIHMYERGVLPEPRRLLELARIGNTTVEWILTGRHWENGSEEMRRVPQEICRLAFLFRDYSDEDREALETALRTIREAVRAVKKRSGGHGLEKLSAEEIGRLLKECSEGTLQALSAALKIHQAVSRAILTEGTGRLHRSSLHHGPDGESCEGADESRSGAERGRQRPIRVRPTSLEAVRGHIYRLDGSLLAINDIVKDRDLRAELEEALARLLSKLESKKAKVIKMKKAQRGK